MQTFLNGKVHLFAGDCREVLRGYESNSFDSVVTDPPYALVSIGKRYGKSNLVVAEDKDMSTIKSAQYSRLAKGFMGKQWDNGEAAFAVEFWEQVFRVLKPGGHVAAFSGTRTYHRLACAIEDAGFEIRDQLAWAYGSGFPKSHDVAKQIDKGAGFSAPKAGAVTIESQVAKGTEYERTDKGDAITADAQKWEGWGTALKPAWEPICLARKPLSGSVAANVLEHGTGALNIDGCRIEAEKATGWGGGAAGGNTWTNDNCGLAKDGEARPVEGRWPANIIHDGSDEVVALFPETGPSTGGGMKDLKRGKVFFGDTNPNITDSCGFGDQGSAARFFYSAKADKQDRIGSKHPTVKPVDLMQWLCRLITPPGGVILDPFAGSGSTGEAAWREGFTCHLIEREPEYQADIAERLRLANAGPVERKQRAIKQKPEAGPLFGEAA